MGWKPEDPKVYAAMLDEALKEGRDERGCEMHPKSLQERCEEIERAVTDVASKCQKM